MLKPRIKILYRDQYTVTYDVYDPFSHRVWYLINDYVGGVHWSTPMVIAPRTETRPS